MKLFVATLKRNVQYHLQFRLIEEALTSAAKLRSRKRMPGEGQTYRLPVPLLFFLFITRREHSLYYPARWKKLAVPLYLSSRPFAKNGSKMRYRVIVKRHVARFAAVRLSSMLIKSHETSFFRSTFPSPVVVGVVRRYRRTPTKSSLLVVGRIWHRRNEWKGWVEIQMGSPAVWRFSPIWKQREEA